MPESVLDVHATQNQTLQSRWTIGDREVADFRIHINVIRHQLTRGLETLTPIISAEIEHAFRREWGTHTEWSEVSVWDSCLRLISGAANGAFCGRPLCTSSNVVFYGRVLYVLLTYSFIPQAAIPSS